MSYLVYNGKRSDEFGVTISGGGTYAAPARDMEAVTIPGVNGHMLIDGGRYENITVTYPGHIARGFDAKIDAFRAFMAASPGYHRLEDTYHPDEYRLAAFRSGLDPETGPLNRSGRFDLVFDCRPERWLKSGDAWTAPVLSCGTVAMQVEGGAVVAPGWLSSPVFEKSAGYDISLKAVPLPGHELSELADVMTDGVNYALYMSASLSALVYSTAQILPSLLATGVFTYSAAASEIVSFYAKKADGFEWHIVVDGVEYVAGTDIILRNPTQYEARPVVKIVMDLTATMTTRAAFNINGTAVTIVDDGTLTENIAFFDCEVGDFYALDEAGQAINLNQYLHMENAAGAVAHAFPVLTPGVNDVSFASDTWLYFLSPAVISISPKWWTL